MKRTRSICNPVVQPPLAGFMGCVHWHAGRAPQMISSFSFAALSPLSYRKYVLKPTSVMSFALSVFACCIVPDTAKAVLLRLRADELGSISSRERDLLQRYLSDQFGEKIKRIVIINTHYFLIPISEEGCERCFYRLVFVGDKVTDVAIFVGARVLWMVPEDSYTYLGNPYTVLHDRRRRSKSFRYLHSSAKWYSNSGNSKARRNEFAKL
jgi:hypothetical protein